MRAGIMAWWFGLLLGVLICPGPAASDIIYFTDGRRTVCQEKAWEENGEIHCEYQDGVLIYSKADVQHIEKTVAPGKGVAAPAPSSPTPSPPAPLPATSKPPAGLQGAPAGPSARRDSGILFYDPRRPKKFWSSETRHHDSFREAVAALAAELERSPEWVEAHMGETNDLLELRTNLALTSRDPSLAASAPQTAPAQAIEFYNPRRAQKYWTGADSRHNTYQEALEALAREFDRPPGWVEAHMGESNDLEQIRQHLRQASRRREI